MESTGQPAGDGALRRVSRTPIVIERSHHPNASKGRRITRTRITLLDGSELEQIEEAGPPPKYYNGAFATLPRPDVEHGLAKACLAAALVPERMDLEAICLTCEKRLLGQYMDDEHGLPMRIGWNSIFGKANDHLRTRINHAVIVVDRTTGYELYRSDYKILKTQD